MIDTEEFFLRNSLKELPAAQAISSKTLLFTNSILRTTKSTPDQLIGILRTTSFDEQSELRGLGSNWSKLRVVMSSEADS